MLKNKHVIIKVDRNVESDKDPNETKLIGTKINPSTKCDKSNDESFDMSDPRVVNSEMAFIERKGDNNEKDKIEDGDNDDKRSDFCKMGPHTLSLGDLVLVGGDADDDLHVIASDMKSNHC